MAGQLLLGHEPHESIIVSIAQDARYHPQQNTAASITSILCEPHISSCVITHLFIHVCQNHKVYCYTNRLGLAHNFTQTTST
jgi:hypothetical protein